MNTSLFRSCRISRQTLSAAFALLAVALVAAPWASPPAKAEAPASQPATRPAEAMVLKGDYTFGGTTGTFTAELKSTGDNTYDVVYKNVTWRGQTSTWKGSIKGDLAGEFTGTGSSSNGAFKFSGKFVGGVAKCTATETGGRSRSGAIALWLPRAGA